MNKILTVILLCLGFVNSMSSQALSFNANTTNTSIAIGDTIIVDVTTSNFVGIAYYQYTMEWDPSIVELITLADCNLDIGLNCALGIANFNETTPGVLRAIWPGLAGNSASLTDGTKLYELRFEAKAEGDMNLRFTDAGLPREAEGDNGVFEGDQLLTSVTGLTEVMGNVGSGNAGDLTFTVGALSGEVGTEACLPITVANFDSVIYYQYTMEWDSSILELVRLQNCNSDIALNCTLGTGQTHFNVTAPGVLRSSWVDQATVGKDIADDAVLFEMCFDLKAVGNSNVSITESELTIEAETKSAGEIDASSINITNGLATVTAAGNGSGGGTPGDLTFTVGNLSGEVGTEACLPVTVANFDSVIFYQYTMEWNSSIIELVRLQNCNSDIALNCTLGTGQTHFNVTAPGVLRHNWLDQATVGKDLADDAVLFEMCFDLKAAGNSNVSITESELTIEAETKSAGEIDASSINITNGTATVTAAGNGGGGGTPGDLTFTVGNLSGEVGTEACLPVTVANFDSVIFYQYTMEWDSSIIELVRLQNCNSDIALNCTLGTGQTHFNVTAPGVLRHNWLDQATVGKDLADDAVLFEMCFDLKAAGNSNVSITESELTIEAETKSAGEIDASSINITNGTATVTAAGNGGGGGTPGDLTFTVGNLSGEVGTEACLPVTVANFDSVIFYQYTMEWDASIIELVRLQNCNSDIALNCTLGTGQTNFNVTAPGVLRHNWLDQATVGKNIADDAVLFEMCFDLKAEGNSNISITDSELTIEAETKAAGEIDASSMVITNGTATVAAAGNGGGNGGGGTPGDLTFTVGNLSGEVGTEACLPVTVANFDSVIFYQYTMEWDASIIELVRLQNCNSDIALNCTLGTGQTNFNVTAPGVLRHNWLDQATVGKNIADDAVLFEMCFDLKAEGNSNISITDSELAIEAETKAAGEIDASSMVITNGTATVAAAGNGGGNGGGGTPGDLTFTVGNLSGEVGTEACLPVTVANFDSVIFYQYTMEWDASIIELVRLQNCNSDIALNCTLGTGQTNFNVTAPGVLRHNWLDQATVGKNIADDAVLFEMCFDLKAEGNSNISITDSELTIEAETKAAGEIDASSMVITNGTATVAAAGNGGGNGGGGTPGDLTFTVGNLSGEVGTEACLPVTVANFDSVIFYQYTMEWDASIIELVRLQNCNSNIALNCTLGTGQTNFNVTAPGVLRHNWLDQATVGKDLADDAVLFEMCFDLKAEGNSNISITDRELTIEAETKSAGEIDASSINITNGTATVTAAGNGGGGGMEPTGPLKFSTTSANVEAGESTCLNVMVDNFIDITTFSFSQTWDASVFELESVMSCNSALTGLNCGLANANFTLVGNNRVDITWTDASGNGVTVSGSDPLFQLCFKAIGDAGEGTNIAYGTDVSASNKDGALASEDIETLDAQISINGTTNNGQLTFMAEGKMGDVGETVCIQVTTDNFDDIVFFQYTMEWDASVLELESLNACNADLGLNCDIANNPTNFNQTSDGSLRASWTDPASVGKSVGDGSVLYEVCFKIVGNAGDNSLVRFTSNEIAIEAQDDVDVIDEQDIVIQNGFVSVNENGGGNIPSLVFNIGEETGRQSDTVCVAVTAENFNDIIHFQYNVEWNSAVLQFVEVQACNTRLGGLSCVEGPTSTNFNLTSPGLLRAIWLDAQDVGVTVPSEEPLFMLCFKLVGNSGASSAIRITDSELGIEASNPSGDISPNNILINNGQINIVTVMPVARIDRVQTTDILCNGASTGAIDIDVSGGIAPLTYAWSNGATTQDISGVSAGNYRVSVTDAENRVIVSDVIQLFEPSAIEIGNIQITQPNMETNVQGAIDIAVSGGSSPFTFLWSNGAVTEDILGLAEGCYTVTVTDRNNCSLTSAEICVENEVTALSMLNTTPGNVICPTDTNGTIDISFSGGVGPFTFALSNGATLSSPSRTATFSDLPIGDYTVVVTDSQNDNLTGPVSIAFTSTFEMGAVQVTHPNEELNVEGAIDIAVSGGSGPYTYAWSNGETTEDISGLIAGCYTVTITDGNNCILTPAEICIEDVITALSTLSTNPGDVICPTDANGTIDISFSGGVGPFTFTLSNGATLSSPSRTGTFTGLPVGEYTVVVTDSQNDNLTGTVSIDFTSTFFVEGAVITSYNGFDVSGFGRTDATITASANGTIPPYSYQWSDNLGTSNIVANVGAGTYTVTITDGNGCVSSTQVTVNQPQELRASATADLMPGCKDVCEGEASVNVEGGVAPYNFLWSTGSTQGVIFDLCAGDYSVSITDANSITTVSSISITEPDSLQLSFDSTSPSTLTGSDGSVRVTVTGGTAPYSYQWNDNNGTQTPEVVGLGPDTYFVIVTDANGCQEIGMVDVTRPTADCYESRNIITIDGDGMNENLIIQCADNVQNTLQVFNRWGQLVFDATNYDNTWEGTDRRGNQLPEGGYFWVLRVTESNGDITEYKNHVTIITAE